MNELRPQEHCAKCGGWKSAVSMLGAVKVCTCGGMPPEKEALHHYYNRDPDSLIRLIRRLEGKEHG